MKNSTKSISFNGGHCVLAVQASPNNTNDGEPEKPAAALASAICARLEESPSTDEPDGKLVTLLLENLEIFGLARRNAAAQVRAQLVRNVLDRRVELFRYRRRCKAHEAAIRRRYAALDAEMKAALDALGG